jgi:hypothetical protein
VVVVGATVHVAPQTQPLVAPAPLLHVPSLEYPGQSVVAVVETVQEPVQLQAAFAVQTAWSRPEPEGHAAAWVHRVVPES